MAAAVQAVVNDSLVIYSFTVEKKVSCSMRSEGRMNIRIVSVGCEVARQKF